MQEMENGHVCKVPFQFRISEQRFPNGGLNHQLSQLPPSLSDGGVLFDCHGKKCMQPLIEYCIHATVTYQTSTHGLCLKAQDSCAIKLIPFTEAGPPLSIDDFPGEFELGCNTSLRKRISNRVVGDLEVSMSEPRPLPVFAQGDKQRDGEGVLNLKLRSAELMTGRILPRGWTFELQVQICMKTFYSTMPMGEVASNFLMQKNGYLRVRSSIIQSKTRKVNSLSWKSDSMNVADDQTASCTASLPFAISMNEQLLPSFCGPLSARRYCLKLQLRIQGFRHSRIALLSPLQVYHCRDDQHEPSAYGARAQSQLQRSLTGDWAWQILVETEVNIAYTAHVLSRHVSNRVSQSPPAYDHCLR